MLSSLLKRGGLIKSSRSSSDEPSARTQIPPTSIPAESAPATAGESRPAETTTTENNNGKSHENHHKDGRRSGEKSKSRKHKKKDGHHHHKSKREKKSSKEKHKMTPMNQVGSTQSSVEGGQESNLRSEEARQLTMGGGAASGDGGSTEGSIYEEITVEEENGYDDDNFSDETEESLEHGKKSRKQHEIQYGLQDDDDNDDDYYYHDSESYEYIEEEYNSDDDYTEVSVSDSSESSYEEIELTEEEARYYEALLQGSTFFRSVNPDLADIAESYMPEDEGTVKNMATFKALAKLLVIKNKVNANLVLAKKGKGDAALNEEVAEAEAAVAAAKAAAAVPGGNKKATTTTADDNGSTTKKKTKRRRIKSAKNRKKTASAQKDEGKTDTTNGKETDVTNNKKRGESKSDNGPPCAEVHVEVLQPANGEQDGIGEPKVDSTTLATAETVPATTPTPTTNHDVDSEVSNHPHPPQHQYGEPKKLHKKSKKDKVLRSTLDKGGNGVATKHDGEAKVSAATPPTTTAAAAAVEPPPPPPSSVPGKSPSQSRPGKSPLQSRPAKSPSQSRPARSPSQSRPLKIPKMSKKRKSKQKDSSKDAMSDKTNTNTNNLETGKETTPLQEPQTEGNSTPEEKSKQGPMDASLEESEKPSKSDEDAATSKNTQSESNDNGTMKRNSKGSTNSHNQSTSSASSTEEGELKKSIHDDKGKESHKRNSSSVSTEQGESNTSTQNDNDKHDDDDTTPTKPKSEHSSTSSTKRSSKKAKDAPKRALSKAAKKGELNTSTHDDSVAPSKPKSERSCTGTSKRGSKRGKDAQKGSSSEGGELNSSKHDDDAAQAKPKSERSSTSKRGSKRGKDSQKITSSPAAEEGELNSSMHDDVVAPSKPKSERSSKSAPKRGSKRGKDSNKKASSSTTDDREINASKEGEEDPVLAKARSEHSAGSSNKSSGGSENDAHIGDAGTKKKKSKKHRKTKSAESLDAKQFTDSSPDAVATILENETQNQTSGTNANQVVGSDTKEIADNPSMDVTNPNRILDSVPISADPTSLSPSQSIIAPGNSNVESESAQLEPDVMNEKSIDKTTSGKNDPEGNNNAIIENSGETNGNICRDQHDVTFGSSDEVLSNEKDNSSRNLEPDTEELPTSASSGKAADENGEKEQANIGPPEDKETTLTEKSDAKVGELRTGTDQPLINSSPIDPSGEDMTATRTLETADDDSSKNADESPLGTDAETNDQTSPVEGPDKITAENKAVDSFEFPEGAATKKIERCIGKNGRKNDKGDLVQNDDGDGLVEDASTQKITSKDSPDDADMSVRGDAHEVAVVSKCVEEDARGDIVKFAQEDAGFDHVSSSSDGIQMDAEKCLEEGVNKSVCEGSDKDAVQAAVDHELDVVKDSLDKADNDVLKDTAKDGQVDRNGSVDNDAPKDIHKDIVETEDSADGPCEVANSDIDALKEEHDSGLTVDDFGKSENAPFQEGHEKTNRIIVKPGDGNDHTEVVTSSTAEADTLKYAHEDTDHEVVKDTSEDVVKDTSYVAKSLLDKEEPEGADEGVVQNVDEAGNTNITNNDEMVKVNHESSNADNARSDDDAGENEEKDAMNNANSPDIEGSGKGANSMPVEDASDDDAAEDVLNDIDKESLEDVSEESDGNQDNSQIEDGDNDAMTDGDNDDDKNNDSNGASVDSNEREVKCESNSRPTINSRIPGNSTKSLPDHLSTSTPPNLPSQKSAGSLSVTPAGVSESNDIASSPNQKKGQSPNTWWRKMRTGKMFGSKDDAVLDETAPPKPMVKDTATNPKRAPSRKPKGKPKRALTAPRPRGPGASPKRTNSLSPKRSGTAPKRVMTLSPKGTKVNGRHIQPSSLSPKTSSPRNSQTPSTVNVQPVVALRSPRPYAMKVPTGKSPTQQSPTPLRRGVRKNQGVMGDAPAVSVSEFSNISRQQKTESSIPAPPLNDSTELKELQELEELKEQLGLPDPFAKSLHDIQLDVSLSETTQSQHTPKPYRRID